MKDTYINFTNFTYLHLEGFGNDPIVYSVHDFGALINMINLYKPYKNQYQR